MAIGKKQGMSSLRSLYDYDGVFECPVNAQNVADRISQHIESLGLPNSGHYVKKKGDGFIIYFLAHDRRHTPLSGVYLNCFLNGINTMKDLQAREKLQPALSAYKRKKERAIEIKQMKLTVKPKIKIDKMALDPKKIRFSEVDRLCREFNFVRTERHSTQRNFFKHQSQYKADVIKIIQWAIKMNETKITFYADQVEFCGQTERQAYI